MKEMTLVEVQNACLDILKDVHAFCEAHQIGYSLAYGTLIGACRHKGFIPWDDDLDIIIPRPDFERFCSEYKSSKGYKLYKPGDYDSFQPFARVCDNEHTLVKTNRPWTTKPTGLWIDVFPVDGLPSDESEFLEHVKKIRKIQKRITRLRKGRYLKLSDTYSFRDFVSCLIKRVLYYRYDIRELLNQHIQLLKSYDYDKADFCGQLCIMDYPEKEHNPKTYYESRIKMQFCDMEFNVINGYDDFMKHYYGNYMELPPEEKRIIPPEVSQTYYRL